MRYNSAKGTSFFGGHLIQMIIGSKNMSERLKMSVLTGSVVSDNDLFFLMGLN